MSKSTKIKESKTRLSICEVQSQTAYIDEVKYNTVIEDLVNKGIIKDFAYILHDKDTYTDDDEIKNPAHKANEPKENHIHGMLRFNNSYKISTIANWFELPNECVRFIKKTFNSACAYLVHRNEPEKFQYSPSEVKSSFDYIAFLNELDEKEKARLDNENYEQALKKNIMLEVQAGTLRGYNFHEKYGYVERLRLRPFLDKAVDEIIKTKLFDNEPRNLEVVYITGSSGAGKTTYAKMIAKERFRYYAVSGEERDPLEDYNGQPAIVLDEIRPSSMKLTSFLKLVDNNTESKAGARYHGKTLIECKLIIITSILPINNFFSKLQDNDKETAIQIKRRCKTFIEMSETDIEISRWDSYKRKYVYCGKIDNPIPALCDIHPKTEEELREEACSILGINLSELNLTPKVTTPIGLMPVKVETPYPSPNAKLIAEFHFP